ncbi:hypothetical protein [Aneurinibacillus migulanus]|nr:hypothetical protein [Aneurinibacillus migulanus]
MDGQWKDNGVKMARLWPELGTLFGDRSAMMIMSEDKQRAVPRDWPFLHIYITVLLRG